MNKTAIKKYAVAARRKLIEAVSIKMRYYGCDEKAVLSDKELNDKLANLGVYLDDGQKKARTALSSRVRTHGFQVVAEEVAYTWFNRLAAIRFMEVNGYLPSGVRILSSGDENRLEPECVRSWERLDFLDRAKAEKAKSQGDEALYRHILVRQCNELGKIIPGMFSAITDYAELLLPDRLYTKDGIVYDLTHSEITEADFGEQVEIIGWLYQYYISEKKDEVFAALKKNVKITKENVPAATQLFTPDWIVRYMVENSLGRLWLEGHPDNDLLKGWKYYLVEAEQTPEVEAEIDKIRRITRSIKPEEIKLIDPCMGSGHILVYAFDVLYQIYLSQGYAERDIPDLILKNNLFGLDIDERACQLTNFALMMKARSYNRRFFRRDPAEIPQPQVYATVGDAELEEYGSLLKVESAGEKPSDPQDLVEMGTYDARLSAWRCRDLLARKYDVVVTNPPYMGSGGMSGKLAEFVKKEYPDSKSDLFASFIERCGTYARINGYQAMITQHSWMFLSSYEKLRSKLLQYDIINMAHLGSRAFDEIGGEVVQTAAFVIRSCKTSGYIGTYIRLVDYGSQSEKELAFLSGNNRYNANEENFEHIPGMPVAYWASEAVFRSYGNKLARDLMVCKSGIMTGDDSFIKQWSEVNITDIKFNCKNHSEMNGSKWFPLNSGGEYRKYYGNNIYVVDLYNDGANIKANVKNFRLRDKNFYFQRGLTWGRISSNKIAFRDVACGSLFGDAGPIGFVDKNREYLLGLLNSKIALIFFHIVNPTMNYQVHDIESIPVLISESAYEQVRILVVQNIDIARTDWDSFETSWDFKRHPLVKHNNVFRLLEYNESDNVYTIDKTTLLEPIFKSWEAHCSQRFDRLKANEEELNRIFIDIYGLQDELTPDVEDKDVTVRRADLGREIRSLISYAVGCMFGRYSLDVEGLAYAGGAWDTAKYSTYIPEDDNILPINDADYFDDDIVVRLAEFVKVVYGAETLEDNLNFIAETLYPNASGTARDKIRRYFLNDFYKDHIKVYQKKPIYWLFDSGKQGGFKALVYLHRYDKHTVGRVRMEYLHPLQRKYEAEIERLTAIANLPETSARDKADSQKRIEVLRKKITECRDYDQVIAHIAVQSIELDLDDGVTTNYAKFQGVEIAQGDGRPPVKMDLLGKI